MTPATRINPWFFVGLCFFALSVSFTARASIGLVMPVWEKELHWSRSFVSTVGAASLVILTLLAPFAGAWIDRRGPRLLIPTGLLALAASMGIIAFMDSKIAFMIAYAAIAAIGFATVATHVVASSITRIFDQRQGLATGIATAGSTAGQLALLPLMAALIEIASWRISYALMAGLALMLALIFITMLPRSAKGTATLGQQSAKLEPLGQRLMFLLRRPAFHVLFWSFFICGFTTTGVIETHLLPFAAFCGFPPLESATAYGVLSGINMAGMILAGWLTDRVHRPLLLGSIYIARAFSFIFLLTFVRDIQMLFIFAVIFGLFDYSTVPVTASLAASHLGKNILGLSMGLIAAGHAFGASIGVFLGGYLFDLFAHYDEVWLASVILASLAGLIVYLLPETRTRQPEAAEPQAVPAAA